MVVGLTGGIGSGKTTVAKMFASYRNVVVYYADIEAKKLMTSSETIKRNLIDQFGKETYLNKELNRPYLANIVFKDPSKLKILNGIVHPEVYKHLNNFIAKNKDKSYILYENAILFENKSDTFCDKIITVTAPLKTRIDRVINRDGTTKNAVKNRITNQWNDNLKTLQSHYVIHNVNLEDTEQQVFKIHNILTNTLY
ncbi:dephospho-CoA kinase [Tenacibaculum sp. MAR_2009_124]|uniref:dephospho-CoA kinase n=1 Tax=Tenacibaculum sp. MAR_2009_124 TaxID=1250059 RepID=UPI00089AAB4B|nr:dephospho-CoA kinase [Tenacibaculum sp. MAR_2009_124]SEB83394.1 dephospho-CoA kinase [Tenacibaculum sp. MAR_2009_124]